MTAEFPKFDFVPMPWVQHAACRGMDPNLFQPDVGQPATEAKEVCNGRKATKRTPGLPPCPVRAECLNMAVAMNERGIWGGTTERERRAIRTKEPRSKKVDRTVSKIVHGTADGYRIETRLGLPPCNRCKEAWHNTTLDQRRTVSGYDIRLKELVTLVSLVNRRQPVDLVQVADESRDTVISESVASDHGEEADV